MPKYNPNLANPRELVNTIVLEARVDARLLARIAEGMAECHIPFRTKSELVRNSLEWVHDVLVQNGIIERYDTMSSEEALEFLRAYGLDGLNRQGRNFPTLSRKILVEAQAETACPQSFEDPDFEQERNILLLVQMGHPVTEEAQKVLDRCEEKRRGVKRNIFKPEPGGSAEPKPEPEPRTHEEEQEQARRAWQEAKDKDEDLKKFRSFRPEIVEE